ncbi:YncE family protein [Sphingobacterium deserti]|uniref:40-residue YVTN family beta-propeller repeat protein n=1 Tax=Sphingobacterium deserti TaxID=1229276 RepID=A0A0B8T7N9_9SPHI|nr:YncE family protein [Sphingobacterium deserti]KGE13765.1 40-residue YVTN family beta-propeller repeat protein [Sphingobacterium deserti]
MNKHNPTSTNMNMLKVILAFTGMTLPILQAAAQQVDKSSPAGKGVYESAFNSKDGHVYVTSAGSRTAPGGALYKINPQNLSIVDSISLKENPPFGIAINNKTQIAYTTNTRTNSVSAIDLKSGKLLATITHGEEKSHTREVIVDEDNNLVYVSDVGDPSSIWVINGKTNTFSHLISDLGKTATGMTFAKSKDKLFVTIMGTNSIAVVDTKTRKIEKSFPSGGEAPINITSDGKRLFVTNQKSGTLTVLDTEGKLLKSIATGAGAIGIAYDPVKNRLYSANRQTGTTTVLDGKTYAVLADLETGSAPNHVRIDPKTGAAFVVNKTKGGRPVEGQAPVVDTNGDTITKIN